MPSSRRLVEVLTNRRLPLRTRLGLLRADVRRRLAPRATYRVRVRSGRSLPRARRLRRRLGDSEERRRGRNLRRAVPRSRCSRHRCAQGVPRGTRTRPRRGVGHLVRAGGRQRRVARAGHRVVGALKPAVGARARGSGIEGGRRRASRDGGIVGTRPRAAGELGATRGGNAARARRAALRRPRAHRFGPTVRRARRRQAEHRRGRVRCRPRHADRGLEHRRRGDRRHASVGAVSATARSRVILPTQGSRRPRAATRGCSACGAQNRLEPIDVAIPAETRLDRLPRAGAERARVPLVAEHARRRRAGSPLRRPARRDGSCRRRRGRSRWRSPSCA